MDNVFHAQSVNMLSCDINSFVLAVPYQHASNPFLGADQGGIEWGGGGGGGPPPLKSPFVTLSFQFAGKGQPLPPVLN